MPGKKLLTKEKEEEHRNGEEDRDVATPAPPEEEPRPGQFVLLSEHHRRLSIAAEDDQMDKLGHDLSVEMSLNDNKQSKYSPRMREKHAKINLRVRGEWLQETAPRLLRWRKRFNYEEHEKRSKYLSVAPHANLIAWDALLESRATCDDVARRPKVRNNAHEVDDVAQQPMDQDNMGERDAASSQSGTHKKKGNQRGNSKNKNNKNNKNNNNNKKKRNKK